MYNEARCESCPLLPVYPLCTHGEDEYLVVLILGVLECPARPLDR